MERYTFRTLFDEVRSQKSDFFRVNFYGILATLLILPLPMMIPLLIDEILLDHPGKITALIGGIFGDVPKWAYVAIMMFVVIVMRYGSFLAQNKKNLYAAKVTQRVNYQLRHRILSHLEQVSLGEYESLKVGGIASKTVNDVESIGSFTEHMTTQFISALLMSIGVIGILLWMNWMLALLVFLLYPVFLGFPRLLGRRTGELMRQKHEAYDSYHNLLNEVMELFIQVRASNQEQNFFQRMLGHAKKIEETSVAYNYKSSVAASASALLTNMALDIFRLFGIIAVAYSDLSIGLMIAFLFYLSTMAGPIQQLMGAVLGYHNTKPALDRINQILSLEKEPNYPQLIDPFKDVGTTSIELKNITFAYGNGVEVLHNVSLVAQKGKKVALIGPSGSGKTTLAQMMVGFYPVHSGEVLYDGIPIEKIGLPIIRGNVALMLQQSLFFNDTIRMNLTLSKEKNDEEIHAALKAAQLDSFIRKLENGLDTRIGKNGVRLSGGQRQRLAIARLILSDPKIIIFDEATSAMDNATEFYLYDTLKTFMEGRTTIIIAHRTTTIKQADYIYLIRAGEVAAEGTFDQMVSWGVIVEDFDKNEE